MSDERGDLAKQFLETVAPGKEGGGVLESMSVPADRAEALMPTDAPPEHLREDVERAVDKMARGEALAPPENFALEAIIIPDKRPAINIEKGDYAVTHKDWLHLNAAAAKRTIKAAIPAIGRIELPGHPSMPYGGTGFVVGPGLLMTNRHVAEIFCGGLGVRGMVFRSGQRAGIDFKQEAIGGSQFLEVRGIVMIHPYWDMALLKVDGLPAGLAPLKLSITDPDQLKGKDVAVIGYPAFDPRNNAGVQNQVFNGVYNVKRLMPGKLNGRDKITSFGKEVPSAKHDSSTLGGASGSAVVDIASGQIVALHFAGIYLKTNYGVPTADLARDAKVVDAGVNFAGSVPTANGPWGQWWSSTEGVEAAAAPVAPAADGAAGAGAADGDVQRVAVSAAAGDGARWTIPIEVSINVGAAVQASGGAPAAAPPAAGGDGEVTEKAVEPVHEDDYANRKGYDPNFLGIEVPLPTPANLDELAKLDDGGHVIPYHHFSVVMHRPRRLALFTASNVDANPASKQPEPGHKYTRAGLTGLGENDRERWFTDPRLRGLDQLPDKFFEKDQSAFDKGHIVRRDDVAWGASFAEVQAANGDTYHVTNCSPQVAGFNRSNHADNWGALEDLVLKQAKGEKLSVFAGPVLAEGDRRFAGVDETSKVKVQIPDEYWKVVVAEDEGQLKSFAFVLTQDLTTTVLEFQVTAAWAHHMISIADLEEKLGGALTFPDAVRAADQKGKDLGEAVRASL